jgi:hypothetical protein
MKKIISIIIVGFYLINPALSQKVIYPNIQKQQPRYIDQKSFGVLGFIGLPEYTLPEGFAYQPLLLGGYFHLPLKKARKRVNLSIDIIPLIGAVPSTNSHDKEFGLNIFLDLGFELSPNSILSLNIGTGPYYIAVTTEKQANGFIFSDYLLLAYKHRIGLRLNHLWEINFYGGVRHVSNAFLKKPNNGIDNIIFGFGFGRLF